MRDFFRDKEVKAHGNLIKFSGMGNFKYGNLEDEKFPVPFISFFIVLSSKRREFPE